MFVHSLFNDTVTNSGCITSHSWVTVNNGEDEARSGLKSIISEGVRKTTNILLQNNWCPAKNSNSATRTTKKDAFKIIFYARTR